MITKKNTKRVILAEYFELTAPSQFTAVMPNQIELDYGLQNVVVEFSDGATKTVNIILNFLFADPANSFRQDNNIILADDLKLSNIPINVDTVINMDYVYGTEEEFLSFVRNFYADNKFEITFK